MFGEFVVKQSWDEYVEGRLAIGGCGLTLLIIGIVVAVIIIGVTNFVKNFHNNWPTYLAILPIVALCFVIAIIKSKNEK